jgi:NlpC/P60 family putative phage cell wall peptidase
MILGQQIVETARLWIGTPYCHQASTKGAGADCLGLLRGVWRAIYGDEPTPIPPYSPEWSEVSGQEALLTAAQKWLVQQPVDCAAMGDVLLFRMRPGCVAKHLGIAACLDTVSTFIHAYTGHGVIESPLSEPWQRKVVARFRFPDLLPAA